MAKTSQGVAYGTPEVGKRATPRGARGRLCAHEGCTTILSTYNTATMCWQHMPWSSRGGRDQG